MSTAQAQPLAEPAPIEIRVPLFEAALNDLAEDQRYVVLDLGRVREGTVDLFGRYRCRLDIANLPAALDALPDEEDPTAVSAWTSRLFPPIRGEKVDLVLCWNLLNYLSPVLIEALAKRIAARAAPGARLHALIEYSATSMPGKPWSYSPGGPGQLIVDPVSGPECPAPRYSPKALEKHLPGFKSERTMLLGNGMQEYLYRR